MDKEREGLVKLVRLWGDLSSDAILDPKTHRFTIESVQGFIGYRKHKNHFYVFGDPVCDPKDKEALAKAFHAYLHLERKKAIFIGCSESFCKWALNTICKASLEFAHELIFNPFLDPRTMTGPQASLVRRKVKQSINSGVVIHELSQSPSVELQQAIEDVAIKWLKSRKGLQVHISNVHLFKDREGKRWFYAEHEGKPIGVITINHLQSKQGWLMNHLMVIPSAPKGTSELLVVSVLEKLQQENCRFVSVGLVTEKTFGSMDGFSSLSRWIAKLFFKSARQFTTIDGLSIFWNKFLPERKEPHYILFSSNKISPGQLMGLFRTLKGKNKDPTSLTKLSE